MYAALCVYVWFSVNIIITTVSFTTHPSFVAYQAQVPVPVTYTYPELLY